VSNCTISGNELRCLNCGNVYEMNLPAPIDIFTATMKAFSKSHAKCKPSAAGRARFQFTTPEEWWRSWDTGESSKTIWRVMMGQHVTMEATPRDPSDFGRCYRLLAAFPTWRARLDEMRKVRGWAPLVDAWPELEALYVEEMSQDRAPKLYAAMKALGL
jgi:hypothetical protein